MKKGILTVLAWSLPFLLLAQTSTSQGINWTTGLSWEQIKQKAKQENKHIFLDCFTTWCGPCKMMDKEVYVNDTVGEFFNKNCLSVKVQMDRTKKDDDYVKGWYSDVDSLNARYRIEGYPTFIFFSPTGKVVDMQLGFKKASEFLAYAAKAIEPGKVYMSPYAQYDSLVKRYNAGIKEYDQMPGMVMVALKLNQNDLATKLLKDHLAYALTLPKEKRYTKQNIEMWNSISFSSKTSVFKFFYNDGKIIDRVMAKKGFSRTVVDKTINWEFVQPFFAEQNKNASIEMNGGMLTNLNGKNTLPVDSSEADWQKLYTTIKTKFNTSIAKRNILDAKVEWYKRHRNFEKYVAHKLSYLDKYCSIENGTGRPYDINNAAFDAFKYSTDNKVIDGYIRWMKKVVERKPTDAAIIDTYANLLYKAGKTKDAIFWEEKAANITGGPWASQQESFKKKVELMKKGQSIWP